MTHSPTSHRPTARRPGRSARRSGASAAPPTVASGGAALAPPAYGIDFVDRAAPARARPGRLPEGLQAGLEALSGLRLDHVRVHHNSTRPAQVDALAFAQGADIHLAPGQAHRLPHEAWHVVQQAQGRVRPTLSLGPEAPVNDEARLEREADTMGERAARFQGPDPDPDPDPDPASAVVPAVPAASTAPVVQRVKTILRQGQPVDVPDDHVLGTGERLPFHPQRRQALDQALHQQRGQGPAPRVGISNRPGLGYDASVFTLEHQQVQPSSLPPGFQPLPLVDKNDPGYLASQQLAEQEKARVQQARDPGQARQHLDGVNGLFIPGGQDRDDDHSPEKTTRQAYEQALVREARLRGLPTLAVCGGSRAFAMGFGGQERALTGPGEVKTHNQGTGSQAHGLNFPDSHTLLGGASPTGGTLDKINSTHKKVVATQGGRITGVPALPGTRDVQDSDGRVLQQRNEPELVVTALDDKHGTPEGFETRHGAPLMGITSHPEAIYRGSSDRHKATPDARTWSDALFQGFEQSMQAYQAKQAVNQAIAPGWSAAVRARQANPALYAKWRGKRNWQKLRQLGMITEREAQEIRDEVAQHRRRKVEHFRQGRPGRERPDPTG